MDEIYNKLKNGEELSETEIRELVWSGDLEDEIEGDDHRWQREVKSVIKVDGQLYAIDWMRALTECQEHGYYKQPYKVKKVEKVVAKTVVSYKKIKE